MVYQRHSLKENILLFNHVKNYTAITEVACPDLFSDEKYRLKLCLNW